MSRVIDRRLNGKNKSTVNRQRFIRRHKNQIKKAIAEQISGRSIKDIDKGENVGIPSKDLTEPTFRHGSGGHTERVFPGNKDFYKGDKIQRPPQGGGQGGGEGEASDSGLGDDDFQFSISKEEYLNLLFEDLELPNLEKTQLSKLIKYKKVRSGFSNEGMPANISVIKSLQKATARRIAVTGKKRKRLRALIKELDQLLEIENESSEKVIALQAEIEELEAKIARVPYIDTFDLRYKNYSKQAEPSTQAVMFCIMDVSGSMDQATKDMAKRFYILLYLFLTRTYKNVEVVFIRHHTQAKEVDENEFFYSKETGGTIVSSALTLMDEIVSKRFPASEWNIYAAQASDGDNWLDDSPRCVKLIEENILPVVRYFAYIEITKRDHQSLWRHYEKIAQTNPKFALQHIKQQSDIYPIFRELFKRQSA
jgi:uncharacterized protein